MFHFFYQPRVQFILRILGGALLACLLWNARVHAGNGDFQPGGRYDYGQFSPSFKPSPGSDGYNEAHRRQEVYDRQAQEWRDEAQRQYRAAPPAGGNSGSKYPFSENVFMPDGKVMTCTKGGSGSTYCY